MWQRSTTTFSHEILWRAAQSSLHLAKDENCHLFARESYLSLQGFVCGFMAFEGFINYVGESVASEGWKPRAVLEAKIEFLFKRFPAARIAKSDPLYVAFLKYKQARNDIAHNRAYSVDEITADERPAFRTVWEDYYSRENVHTALDQLRLFAERIRVEALKYIITTEDYPITHLRHPTFGGPIATASGKQINGDSETPRGPVTT